VIRVTFGCVAFAGLMLSSGSGSAATQASQAQMTPRQVVEAFQKLAFEEYKPVEAIMKYISPNVVEHDPTIPSTRDAIIAYMKDRDWTKGGPKSDIKRIISEGEYVVVHHHLTRKPGEIGIAAVDIFRVKDGLIIEHWDVLQPIPVDSPNKAGMF
jgi:predicted SnoaL-like aldol condensation-catalyzing enzyme